MQMTRKQLTNQLLSLLFVTLAMTMSATIVAVIAYDAGFADGTKEAALTIGQTKVHLPGNTGVTVTNNPDSYPTSYVGFPQSYPASFPLAEGQE